MHTKKLIKIKLKLLSIYNFNFYYDLMLAQKKTFKARDLLTIIKDFSFG